MPIYMDIHQVPGVEALDLAEAHRKDMLIQEEHQCTCMTYWLDVARGVAFCLIEAPHQGVVEEMHRKSHGLVPNKIIEVNNALVESFLGRIQDPEDASISDNGLKVFSESAIRILLLTDMTDPVLLRHSHGPEKTHELLNRLKTTIRTTVTAYGGREVEYAGHGHGSIASFSSAARAVACAVEIQRRLPDEDKRITGIKIGLNAGEPVAESDRLFGDTIQLARYLCTIASNGRILIAAGVKELLAPDYFSTGQDQVMMLSPQDETLVKSLFLALEDNWQDTDFDVTEFGQAIAMSKSGLYRKTMAFWGLPPNLLLKEFRLDKARQLLKSQSCNIAQTTFDSGFSSPSYFTKCFKKRYGLLPAMYLDSVQ